jgi:antitoxin CptB
MTPPPIHAISAAHEEKTMTGTTRSTEGMDARRRKLLFRSWHRGIREMDLILGGFADEAIGSLTDDELHQYEHLLEVQDADLLAWVTGTAPIPAAFDTPLFNKIMASRAA